jgi:hypothetical protein
MPPALTDRVDSGRTLVAVDLVDVADCVEVETLEVARVGDEM